MVPVAEAGPAAQPVATLPPMPGVVLVGLLVSTAGFYGFFWFGRIAADLRRHLDGNIRVWRNVLGSLVPVVNLIVLHRLARRVAELNRRHGLPARPTTAKFTVVLVLVTAVAWPINYIANHYLPAIAVFTTLIVILLLSVPMLMVQRALNDFKASLTEVEWLAPVNRMTVRQGLACVAGFPL